VKGTKHVVLVPPVAAACVNEKRLPAATYKASGSDSIHGIPDEVTAELDEPFELVPFATWDPDYPKQNTTSYSRLAIPLRVTLEAGDVLYLPAMWYHKISLTCGPEGFCCSVNFW
jgi:peptidyl-lysine (3S)-dioxygenase / protease